MSRLTNLLRRLEKQDPALAQELTREYETLSSRRSFGLNFERHVPESVELPDRKIRRGDKVRFRAPRGESDKNLDQRLWLVTKLTGTGLNRTAHLVEFQAKDKPETATRFVEDLIVVAAFRDPIYPGLASTGKIERGGHKPFHTVINGENFHALEALLFAYEGKVDCIYIDPPYNTRDKDWKYNNDYVDSDDAYRHSKWLAMMERRLKLAKRLLNPEASMLILTIDEKEVHRLGLLLEQIFPSQRAQMVSIVINPLGQERKQELARVEEYGFFIFLGSAMPHPYVTDFLNRTDASAHHTELENAVEATAILEINDAEEQSCNISASAVRWERLIRGGGDATRQRSPDLFYPVFIDPEKRRIVSIGERLDKDEVRRSVLAPEGCMAIWPLRKSGGEGRWRCSPNYFQELLDKGYAKVGQYNSRRDQWTLLYLGKAQIKRIETGEVEVIGSASDGSVVLGSATKKKRLLSPKTVWHHPAHRAGEYGTSMLGSLIPGRVFPYPKSLYAVADALRIAVADNLEAIVLDFFAGSGTTAHAVIRLNHQDGGRRRSILVTNNEVSAEEEKTLRAAGHRPGDTEWEALGICEYITKPRIKAAITGLTPDGTPIKGDYKFTDEFPMAEGFEENAEFFDLTYEDPERIRYDLAFSAIAPLLWMRAGSEGRRIDTQTDTFDIADTYSVLFDVDAASGFLDAVQQADRLRIAYIVTNDERQFQIIARELPENIEPIRLYESYLGTFRINTGDY